MDPLLGQIFFWPVSWLPEGFMFCQGQLLNIMQYQALYSILGIRYGGDGKTTFGLPNFSGRVGMGAGTAPAGSVKLGQYSGQEGVKLTSTQLPAHTHSVPSSGVTTNVPAVPMPSISITASVFATTAPGTTRTPGYDASPAKAPDTSASGINNYIYGMPGGSITGIVPSMTPYVSIQGGEALTMTQPAYGAVSGTPGNTGGDTVHNNMQPFLALNFIIAVNGSYPSRP